MVIVVKPLPNSLKSIEIIVGIICPLLFSVQFLPLELFEINKHICFHFSILLPISRTAFYTFYGQLIVLSFVLPFSCVA